MSSSYQKAILKDAEQLGFAFDGFDGHGHIRLRHQQAGVRYSMAATPGDVRSYRNALSLLDGLVIGTEAAIVTYPGRYFDERGFAMWEMVANIVDRLEWAAHCDEHGGD